MKQREEEQQARKPYEKPKLITIELAVEEVLGVGCKLLLGGAAFGASPCPLNSCLQEGS